VTDWNYEVKWIAQIVFNLCKCDDWGSRVWFPAGAGNFSLHHGVQNGSGAHPASYPMGIRGSFPGGKAAGAWGWPPPSSAEVKECVELYLHSPIRFHGVVLILAQGLYLIFKCGQGDSDYWQ
jgi:hypothetical protein